jgi:predicted MFS family arabinose efflux permease
MGLVTTLPAFLMLRFVGGMASAFVLIVGSAFVLEYLAEARRDELSAVHFAGVGSGIAVSAALVSMLTHLGQPWWVLWFASGALSAAALVAATLLLPSGADAMRPVGRRSGASLDPRLRRLIIGYGFYGFGYVITATFLVAIVRATPAIHALEPVTWIVFGLAAAPSIVLWTRIAARFGIPAAFAWACIIEAVGVLASVAWPSATGVFIAAILVGGTFMGLTALGLIRARELAPSNPRRALAFLTTSFGVGQIVGPYFAGIVSDQLGSFTVPSIAAAVALLIAAVLAR